ncbi:MAG: hypothetical protein KF905_11885 [Flavobacteriales bacterium]|nr:hypothetical protein [Flavobacteriales bacterium]
MRPDEQFDELARQKLDARSFPFEEAHWAAAQALLDQQRAGKRRGFWYFGGIAALLIGVGIWWLASPSAPVPPTEEVRSISATPPTGDSHQDRQEPKQTIVEQPGTTATSAPSKQNSTTNEPLDGRNATMTNSAQPAVAQRSKQTTAPGPDTAAKGHQTASAPSTMNTSADASQEAELQSGSHQHRSTDTVHTADTGIADHGAEAPTTHTRTTTSTSLNESTAPAPETITEAANTAAISAEGTSSEADEDSIMLDAATLSTARDTAEQLVVQQPLLSAVARSPWELSLWGGLFNTSSRYGAQDAANEVQVSGAETRWGVGFEAVHMGRNFGLGTGLHYGTYADAIALDERNRIDITSSRYWFLAPVTTTILVVTDTVFLNGAPYFVGQSVDTTVLVIQSAYENDTSTTRLRDALSTVTTSSYFEVPLLLDAHLTQGRWSLGFRGGPTVALLSGRSGILPNSSGFDVAPVSEQTFRQVMFGYTARAYIRYRWNAAWSVGLEPLLRGQFGNGLNSDALSRQSSAAGVVMSVSYRMR